MGRKIVVTSGKGGVGKTTVTAGLGRSLASLGKSVCLVDADIGLNNLDIAMEAEDRVIYDLADCMQAKCRLQQAVVQDLSQKNLYFLASGKLVSGGAVNSFASIVNKLATIFDYVLVDCPAGRDDGFKMAISACEEVILVTTPHPSALRDASRIANIVRSNLGISAMLVINRQRGDLVASGQMLDYPQIAKLLNLQVLGVLPECDSYNITSSLAGERTAGSKLWVAMCIMGKNLHNCTNNIYDCTSGYSGVIGSIKRKLKGIS